jgi:2-desacetyl-2-hydroxyethyl bacteriochlorophyllide A dehydrogenase
MRAAIVRAPGQLSIEDVPDPAPADHQAIVAVDLCGVCGTDLHVLDGDYAVVKYPMIPGHEFGGTVVAVGSAVRDLTVGQRVAVDPMDYCDACANCRAGWTNMCLRGGGLGTTVPGAFADFVAVTAARCEPLPDDLPPDLASLVEPLSCVLHAVDRIGPMLGCDVLVIGAGPIGLMMTALATAAGGRVDVVDRNPERLSTPAEFGALRSATSVAELDRGGWDVAVDATGSPAAVADAVAHLRRTGRLALLGVASPAATFAFAPFEVVGRELTIVGVNSVRHSFGRAARLLPGLPARLLHDDPLPLDQAGVALERVRSATGLKTRVLVGGTA